MGFSGPTGPTGPGPSLTPEHELRMLRATDKNMQESLRKLLLFQSEAETVRGAFVLLRIALVATARTRAGMLLAWALDKVDPDNTYGRDW